jgi:exosortase K
VTRFELKRRAGGGWYFAAALAIAYLVKRHYSSASADELRWILGPTAVLVEAATGAPFAFVPGEGYLSREAYFLIAPACAGLNFLVAAFLAGCVLSARLGGGALRRAGALAGALAFAAVATLAANALRISLALKLHTSRPELFGLDPAGAHRLLGVVIYVACLCGFFALGERALLKWGSPWRAAS